MDTTGIASSVFVPEPKYSFDFLHDSHTQFVIQGFKNYPSTEMFPDDFGFTVWEKNHIPSLINFLQLFENL